MKEYADLLDQKSALYRKIEDQVNDRCLAGSAYGRAQRKAGGLPVQLAPAIKVDSGFNDAWDPFPADLWEKGQKKFVCTFEQDEPGTLSFADFPTRKAPVQARVCVNTPRKYVSCSGKHNAEQIAGMTLNTAVEQGQINARKAVRNGTEREVRRALRRGVREARQDLPDLPHLGLDEEGRRRRQGLPGLREAVADRVRRLRRELLRARRRRGPAAADQGDGLRQGLTWLPAAGQRCRPHDRL